MRDRLGITGIILTKMDRDARGGAALSIHKITGAPIKFVGVGEKLAALARDAKHKDATYVFTNVDMFADAKRLKKLLKL